MESGTTNLMRVYARYFLMDYLAMVYNDLNQRTPLNVEELGPLSEKLVDSFAARVAIDEHAVNAMSKYLFECATFAQSRDLGDLETREVYDLVSKGPSASYGEIVESARVASVVYDNVIRQTILGILAQDAKTTSDLIIGKIRERLSNEETGGRLHVFDWGILNDPVWLNRILTKSYDVARIHTPGERPIAYWATNGFGHAQALAKISQDMRQDVGLQGAFNILSDNQEKFGGPGGDLMGTDLFTLLFNPGSLSIAIDEWQRSAGEPRMLVKGVGQASSLATIVQGMIKIAGEQDDAVINSALNDRLHQVLDAVMVALGAFEALRVTTYENTLIIEVVAPTTDPSVDVFVNGDTYKPYLASGGSDDDLMHMGVYLDPLKGIPTQRGGWDFGWVLSARDSVVPQVIASTQDRIAALRNQDAGIVMDIVTTCVSTLTNTYASAMSRDQVPTPAMIKTTALARALASKNDLDIDIGYSIVEILVATIDDRLVTKAFDAYTSYDRNGDHDGQMQLHAVPLSIGALALDDACQMLSGTFVTD